MGTGIEEYLVKINKAGYFDSFPELDSFGKPIVRPNDMQPLTPNKKTRKVQKRKAARQSRKRNRR